MQMEALSTMDKLLIIPDYVDKVKETKRGIDAGRLAERVSLLKNQQFLAYHALLDFREKKEDIFVLKGYAGTGKTFITCTIIEQYLLDNPGINIAVSAPTNKAVKVLRKMFEFTNKNLQFATTYSVLGMKEVIDPWGKQDFVRDYSKPSSIDTLQLLLIDETSMMADKLFNYILPYVERKTLQVIFVGDPAQIPPIGKRDCIPFDPVMQLKHKMRIAELTEIIRQKAGNPIIDLTLEVRSNPLSRDPIKSSRFDSMQENGAGVCFLGGDDRKEFSAMLRAYFTSENFRRDPDFAHIVAYRNKTVADFNGVVRRLIYGKERASEESLIVGEKLIANKPICENYGERVVIVFNNSDEFEVLEFTVKSQEFWKETYTFYDTLVMTDEGEKEKLKILHPESYLKFQEYADGLKDIALAKQKGSWQASEAWKNWYAFNDIFADVNYNYAITAHKSQGSTYENCIVMESDIDCNTNITERNKIKYTAFSRPSHRLIIAE